MRPLRRQASSAGVRDLSPSQLCLTSFFVPTRTSSRLLLHDLRRHRYRLSSSDSDRASITPRPHTVTSTSDSPTSPTAPASSFPLPLLFRPSPITSAASLLPASAPLPFTPALLLSFEPCPRSLPSVLKPSMNICCCRTPLIHCGCQHVTAGGEAIKRIQRDEEANGQCDEQRERETEGRESEDGRRRLPSVIRCPVRPPLPLHLFSPQSRAVHAPLLLPYTLSSLLPLRMLRGIGVDTHP